MNERIAYHLVPEPWYRDQSGDRPYLPEPFDRDGFIHLTHGEGPVIVVGNTFYRDDLRPYLLLTVDLTSVSSAVRYEDPTSQYPHIYGPLNREAIIAVRRVVRESNGEFVGVTEDEATDTTESGR